VLFHGDNNCVRNLLVAIQRLIVKLRLFRIRRIVRPKPHRESRECEYQTGAQCNWKDTIFHNSLILAVAMSCRPTIQSCADATGSQRINATMIIEFHGPVKTQGAIGGDSRHNTNHVAVFIHQRTAGIAGLHRQADLKMARVVTRAGQRCDCSVSNRARLGSGVG